VFNLISAVFAFGILAIILAFLISLFFKWLTLYIGACIVGVSDRNRFINSHLLIVILVDVVSSILINAVSNLINPIVSTPFLMAAVSAILTFICHYYVSFKNDSEGIRKGMAIFYAITSAVFLLI
jgi:uncharacterized membrane protein